MAPQYDGRFRVPTLRNVDNRPRPDFIKAYGLTLKWGARMLLRPARGSDEVSGMTRADITANRLGRCENPRSGGVFPDRLDWSLGQMTSESQSNAVHS